MGMRPKDFWSLSFKEWILALEGFVEFNTPQGSAKPFVPLTKKDPEWQKLMGDKDNGRS